MLTLPACHTTRELALARRIASDLESDELHVFWSERLIRSAAPPAPSSLSTAALAVAAVGALIDALTSALAPRTRA